MIQLTRQYIAGVVKYCEKKGNEALWKKLNCIKNTRCYIFPLYLYQNDHMLHFRYLCPKMPLSQVPAWIYQPRRDKYNKNIKKYHVDVDSDEEDENIDEEREKE